jgi:hypothetical protein
MIGHIPELVDPANSGTRVNAYPNSYYTDFQAGSEPSIRGKTLYIPLHLWFQQKPSMAFPLISLQYNELSISITLRPVQQWFMIRDVYDYTNNFPYIAPNFNVYYMQFYRFLQTPPDVNLSQTSFVDTRTIWNFNLNMIATYCFLSDEESRLFALKDQQYLIKQIKKDIFYNVCGPSKVQLDSIGMVSNVMFYLQRSDVNMRNEWSNFSNWPYNYIPNDLVQAPTTGAYQVTRTDAENGEEVVFIGPGVNRDGSMSGIMITGDYAFENTSEILTSFGILFDGSYRENLQPAGVYNLIEKYIRGNSSSNDGLYVYNFCLNPSLSELQPSGAVSMTNFAKIEFEFNTIVPNIDINAQTIAICAPNSGNLIGINKSSWRLYEYTFNLTVFQERYNMLTFTSGNCGMAYAL